MQTAAIMRDRAIIGAYVLALATFAVLAFLVLRHVSQFGEQTRWVHHTQEVLRLLEQTLGELRDVETGQRGYLIAGDDQFLEPYDRARAAAIGSLDALRTLTADNPAQQAHIRDIRGVIDQKLSFTEQSVELYRRGDPAGAHAMVRSRRGKQLMDDIRRRIGQMTTEERRLLDLRTHAAEATGWRTNLLIVGGNAMGFAFLAAATLLLGRELNRRRLRDDERAFAAERDQLRSNALGAQRSLEAVVAEIPVGVILVEPSGKVLLDNPAMRAAYGTDIPHGPAWPVAFERPDGTRHPQDEHPLARSARRGQLVRAEPLQLVRADGARTDVIVSSAPVHDDTGRLIAAIGVVQDASEIQRNEQQRRDLERFRDVFLGALGHDLRNPLTVITTGAASLARHTHTATEAKIAARMASSADRMGRMIAQLLDLVQARLGSGLPLKPERSDLRDIAWRVIDRLEMQHPERTIERSAQGELVGSWDTVRIAEMVHELVLNALEHGRTDAHVRVTLSSSDGTAIIEAQNVGNVIPADLMPLIFDPFRRAAERKRMKSVGLGLGLYLAQQIVHGHGGSIDVESTAETGTRFRVRLPRHHE